MRDFNALFPRLGEIGFPEFTAKLVKDVFDALLGTTLRQMEQYSELVAATAKTLQENYKNCSVF